MGEKSCENCAHDTPEGVCKLGEVECWNCAYGTVDRWEAKPRPEVDYAPSPREPHRGGDEEDNESSCERDPSEKEVENP